LGCRFLKRLRLRSRYLTPGMAPAIGITTTERARIAAVSARSRSVVSPFSRIPKVCRLPRLVHREPSGLEALPRAQVRSGPLTVPADGALESRRFVTVVQPAQHRHDAAHRAAPGGDSLEHQHVG